MNPRDHVTPRVTYVSLGSSPELDAAFEAALDRVRSQLGTRLASIIEGRPANARELAAPREIVELRSPIDRRIRVAEVELATPDDARRALAVAHAAYPSWRDERWEHRVATMLRAADIIVERRLELAAWMVFEIGKTRLEALAEVEESADLLRYYASRLVDAGGYRTPMAQLTPQERTESVLRPYGAWAVIAPFNFPSALAAGMVGAALVTGNTVVLKPAELAPVSGVLLCQALWDAGVPAAVLGLVLGEGAAVGAALVADPNCAGVAFTGSYDVGMSLLTGAVTHGWPRPVVAEMGGKNPCIVTASADLDAAAHAVARSAFGFGGQKCSACSRVYVERSVHDAFLAKLLVETSQLTVGNPLERSTFVGPVIDQRAVGRFAHAIVELDEAGGEVVAGGTVKRDGDLAHGYYVSPTVARLADPTHRLYRDELFLPFVLVHPVADLEHGLVLANQSHFGLTAGLFSQDPAEVARFCSEIEAGVLYVNRRSGATTGAWPGVNPFGGWKGSGSTGPAALGPHYLLKFLREQSRAVSGVVLDA